MYKFLCMIDSEYIDPQLEAYLEALDNYGYEVYLYTNVSNSHHDPLDVLYELDQINMSGSEDNSYIFITNVKSLFEIVYRVLHQVFDGFVFYAQADTSDYNAIGIYHIITTTPISENELLNKPIYSNTSTLHLYGMDFSPLDYMGLIETFSASGCAIHYEESYPVRKYYYYDGIYYVFEPIQAEQKAVIQLDAREKIHTNFSFPGFDKLQYMYSYNRERLNELFIMLDMMSEKDVSMVLKKLESLEEEMKGYFPFVFCNTCCILEDAAQLVQEGDLYRSLLLHSFLMQITKNTYHYNEFLKLVNSGLLTRDNKFFLWHQCKRYSLTKKITGNQESSNLLRQIYHNTFLEYETELKDELKPIPKEERNNELIVIFTIQFLSEGHAPTRTTLERCYTLGKLLGKKILLINTKEQYTEQGFLPIYNPTYGNVIPEFSQCSSYQYKDLIIPFYQPSESMPTLPVIREIIEQIRIIKPSMIFSIGNGSIVADLCGKLVPEASIGVAFSNLTTTEATFSVIGRQIGEGEWDGLYTRGYTRNNIIESTFTFELKKKKGKISRENLNLPTDRFLLVTVGIRLDTEVEDDFFEMLEDTYSYGTHIVFAGNFERYNYFCDRHPSLREHSTYIGYFEDILSLMELCDLYVNPRRLGGGFSIIEAFHEGKPGVTINTGDIAVAAGKDFCVKDYKEMTEVIKRYIEDKDYYNTMVEKARDREVFVTDSARAMEDILYKIQNNPLYF